jgi:hypothetical protein
MRSYCTYFDHHYLARGLALYESLRQFRSDSRLFVLCLSDECFAALQKLDRPGLELIRLADFEAGHAALARAKANRSVVEYYFTCTPWLPWFVLRHYPEVDTVSYLDSDMYFFNDPELIHQEVGSSSIAITPHRFPAELQWKEKFGRFNVGLLTFRRDEQGLACLEHWGAQCLDWCYDRYEDGRFADQKYLDEWPARFTRLKILEHPGINTAPWNLPGRELSVRGGQVRVDAVPLILFHFHKLKPVNRWIYDPNWQDYGVQSRGVLRHNLYRPYIEHLERLRGDLQRQLGLGEKPRDLRRAPRDVSGLRRVWRASPLRPAWYGLLAFGGVFLRRKFMVYRGHVFRW